MRRIRSQATMFFDLFIKEDFYTKMSLLEVRV